MAAEPSLSRSPASGRLALSLTLVLRRQPSPAEDSLLPLVSGGVFSAGVTIAPDPKRLESLSHGTTELRALFPAATRFELRSRGRALAAAGVAGSTAALCETLSREDALALLAVLRGEPSELLLAADVSYRAVYPPAEPRRVKVSLDLVFERLASVAGGMRILRLDELERELAGLATRGAIDFAPPPGDAADAIAASLPTLLVACRPILQRVDTGEEGAPAVYRLATQAPAPGSWLTVRTSSGPTPLERILRLARPMMDVCRAAFAEQSLDAIVAAVCAAPGGTYEPLARKVAPAARAAPGEDAPALASFGASAAAMAAALKVGRAPASAGALLASDLVSPLSRRPAHAWMLNDLVVNGLAGAEKLQHLPVISGTGDSWPDRIDAARRWYAPQLEWVRPAAADVPASAPFLFSFEVTGHDAQGRPGLEATVRLTLRASAPAGAGNAAPVPMGGLSVSLEIPYRDEGGATRTHALAAGSVTRDGERCVATFRLTDTWARLCYGALATPGFQREPVRLLASYVFPAYVRVPADTKIAYGGKAVRPPALHAAALHASALHTAAVASHPHLVAPVVAAGPLHPVRYGIRTQGRSFRAEVSVACSEHGSLFRQSGEGDNTAIGCQDAYALGQARLRLYEPVAIDLGALRPGCRVFRSLQVPGRFLILPQAYVIARFEPGDARAYRPALFLFSNVDALNPEKSRCVAMATLQPDLQPYARAALVEYLRSHVHPDPTLEWPTELGVAPKYQWALPGGPGAIEPAAAKTPEGFQVSLATGIQEVLQLKAIFERGGVHASVQFPLEDGTVLDSTLTVDLARVNGPWSGGPVSVEIAGPQARLTNRIEQPVDVGALMLFGGSQAGVPVGRRLAAGESVTVPAPGEPASAIAQYAYAGGVASLDEVRTFIEDIFVDALFVANFDFAALGLAELAVESGIAGMEQTLVATLLPGASSATVRFVLPLTTYLGQPVLRFRVSRRRADGSRTGPWHDWQLSRQGGVIEINATLAQEE